MDVAIFGAGYVGCVTAACLAAFGHRVWLVEIHPEKLALLRQGQSPVFEPKLDSAFREGWRARRILPVVSGAEAVPHTEVALVCVGTPSQRDDSPDVTQLRQVLCEIADTLAMCTQPYVIALRSTVPFPQVREELLPIVQDRLPDRFGADVTASLLCPTPEAALHGTQLVIVGKMLLSEAQLQTLCPAGTWVLDLTRQLPTHLPPLRLLRFNSAAAAASAARYGR